MHAKNNVLHLSAWNYYNLFGKSFHFLKKPNICI